MKIKVNGFGSIFLSTLIMSGMILGCSDSNGDEIDALIENSGNSTDDQVEDSSSEPADDASSLSVEDQDALLFMLEEEKLARDTYKFLNEQWRLVQFENIMQSEQFHMDAVEALLKAYGIGYEILENGKFNNEDLQALYNKFVLDGVVDKTAALTIGATIEDLDIVDLEENIQATSNNDIANVFASLQCGSRNHLRSFTQSLENIGSSYEPQFLTVEEYQSILDGSHEQCN